MRLKYCKFQPHFFKRENDEHEPVFRSLNTNVIVHLRALETPCVEDSIRVCNLPLDRIVSWQITIYPKICNNPPLQINMWSNPSWNELYTL